MFVVRQIWIRGLLRNEVVEPVQQAYRPEQGHQVGDVHIASIFSNSNVINYSYNLNNTVNHYLIIVYSFWLHSQQETSLDRSEGTDLEKRILVEGAGFEPAT